MDSWTNKTQSLIKLEIAKYNLEGVHRTSDKYEKLRLKKAMEMINEVLKDLKEDRKRRLEKC